MLRGPAPLADSSQLARGSPEGSARWLRVWGRLVSDRRRCTSRGGISGGSPAWSGRRCPGVRLAIALKT